MPDTDSYNIFYKEKGAASYQKIEGVQSSEYTITELKDKTTYEVYLTGVNELGESGPSIHSEARTTTLTPAQMPGYKLLNESDGKGQLSTHILSVTHGRGSMVGSSLDEGSKNSALGVADKDYGSYYQVFDWDDGASYPSPDKGLLFKLDDYYKMNYITFAEAEDLGYYNGVYVYYYDEAHPDGTAAKGVSLLQKTDPEGRRYYAIKLSQAITANKIRLGFTRSGNYHNIVIAEVNFYYYDSLEDDILALYADDLHTVLKADVTEDTIDQLQKRLDTKDEKSGEYHPERTALQKELDNAKGLLNTELREVVQINPAITAAKDGHLGFGGLNAWQPLGVTAYEGEQLVIYVGHNKLKTGSNASLRLVATQYHAEASAMAVNVATLKVGRNEITVPPIQSLSFEGGGALYIQYTGNDSSDRYAVRVSGGAKEPVLNLYGITDEEERKARINTYVQELEEQTENLEKLHKELHQDAVEEDNKVNRDFDRQNCILGATDIMLDQMMYSVAGEQILKGLGKGSSEEKAERLDQSLKAMEQMLHLFYQHKGLSTDDGAPASDRMPVQHLNIRYMRMFAGAFMYASGNHVGIEWGSVSGLAKGVPVSADNGKYESGSLFGWGIAHEIGHNINQGTYAIAEITNNYFALLSSAKDTNDSIRFQYDKVYQKVTSNTVGRSSDVFTQLALYWQLHLAYDRGYNYKTYDTYEEQQKNLFFARVDSYARNTSRAPAPKGIALKLDGDTDQKLMRLACAAAGKNLLEFFERWGMQPDEGTISYAGQFDREERAVYYLTDDARVYEIEHGTENTIRGKDIISGESSAAVSSKIPNEVTIAIQNKASDQSVILGYEIARYEYAGGKAIRRVIGFTTDTQFVDHVTTINNRVMTYEVIAVDQFGYRSSPQKVGTVKISHDGSHDKSDWTVTTNMTSDMDKKETATEELPCEPEAVPAIQFVIDNDYKKNTYTGKTTSGGAAILLNLHEVLQVSGLKMTVAEGTPIRDYVIEISTDGSTWTTVKTGAFENKSGSQTVYFENEQKDPWICTYDAAYVRLKTSSPEMTVTELDLLGPAGDNISFGTKADSTAGAVGILGEEYVYEQKGEEKKSIPEGSLIFTGSYKGNPAYNVVVLYDEQGNVAGAPIRTAH